LNNLNEKVPRSKTKMSDSSFLTIPNTTVPCPDYPPADPAIAYPFSLDPFQQWAVAAIHRDENVLVTAKTGSGKTLVAEYAIAYALREGKRVFYTTPIKSLSNQKYHDLKNLFPEATVGILTGDIKSNPDAQIVVMTTEILRNLLFKHSTATATLGIAGAISLEGLGTIVHDEVHYLNDPDRGHVWEECLILTPPAIRMVLLSATIDNPEGLARWIGEIKRVRMHLLKTSYRIVPLVHGIFCKSAASDTNPPMLVLKTSDESQMDTKVYGDWLRSREKRKDDSDKWKTTVATAKKAGESAGGREGKVKAVSFQHQLNECIDTLKERDMLPALFFTLSRKDCERYADKVVGSVITSSETADIKHIMSFHLHRHMSVLEKLPQYHQITKLLERGVAFHHSGMLPLLKEIVELLFTRGFIKILFCTESLAVGLNMPARSVVFLGLEKPAEGGGFRPLFHAEYQQMAGRAGRRGKDTRGFVFYLPAKEPLDVADMKAVLSGSLTPLSSRIQFHYDFILKAIHLAGATATTSEEQPVWVRILEESYWTVQRKLRLAEMEAVEKQITEDYETARARLTDSQREAFVEKAKLEHTFKTTGNSKKRAAMAGLRTWESEHEGQSWIHAARIWESEKSVAAKMAKHVAETDKLRHNGADSRLQPVLSALRAWEYLDSDNRLTHRGTLATEVNEGNPIMMTELYLSGILKNASASEIVSTLAAFIADRDSTEKSDGIHVGILGQTVVEAFTFLTNIAKRGFRIDTDSGVQSSEMYWCVAPYWMEIAKAWMEGTSAAHITSTYDIYEGNFMRGILKIYNLVEEWQSIATFCGDVATLDKLRDIQQVLLRDIAQPESLYLRL
jgi:superfamily II RNA helicase